MKFAKALAKDRIASGMTQAELGERCKITRMQVSKFELGTTFPEPKEVRRLAKVLGIDGSRYEIFIIKDFAKKRGLKKVKVTIG